MLFCLWPSADAPLLPAGSFGHQSHWGPVLCPISNSSPARMVIPSFILSERRLCQCFCADSVNSGSRDVVGGSFTFCSVPHPGTVFVLGTGQWWRTFLRIHPVSSREKKTDQKQQIWQQRGREMGRRAPFSLLPRSSCLGLGSSASHHQPWGFALGLHRSGSGLLPTRKAAQSLLLPARHKPPWPWTPSRSFLVEKGCSCYFILSAFSPWSLYCFGSVCFPSLTS